jgi:hypothetical protein
MAIGTVFTLLILPAVYLLIAADRRLGQSAAATPAAPAHGLPEQTVG